MVHCTGTLDRIRSEYLFFSHLSNFFKTVSISAPFIGWSGRKFFPSGRDRYSVSTLPKIESKKGERAGTSAMGLRGFAPVA